MLEVTTNAYKEFAGDGWYTIFALICILIMCRDKNNKNYYGKPILLLVLILLNPVLLFILEKYWIKGARLPKIFIVIPIFLCISYVISNNIKKRYFIIITVFILIISGTNILTYKNFEIPTNLYKLNNCVIEICDYINELEGNSDQEIKLLADKSLVCYIRQYDPRFVLEFGRNLGQRSKSQYAYIIYDELYQKDSVNPDILNNCAVADGCKYLIILHEKKFAMDAYQYITSIKGYDIYAYHQ